MSQLGKMYVIKKQEEKLRPVLYLALAYFVMTCFYFTLLQFIYFDFDMCWYKRKKGKKYKNL